MLEVKKATSGGICPESPISGELELVADREDFLGIEGTKKKTVWNRGKHGWTEEKLTENKETLVGGVRRRKNWKMSRNQGSRRTLGVDLTCASDTITRKIKSKYYCKIPQNWEYNNCATHI